eukprot:scaffold78879_cov45-Attheya_sp.AAC.1
MTLGDTPSSADPSVGNLLWHKTPWLLMTPPHPPSSFSGRGRISHGEKSAHFVVRLSQKGL